MKNTISLPGQDHTGKLTPLVLDAMQRLKATSSHDPKNHDNIVLTFHSAKDREEFAQALAALQPRAVSRDEATKA